MSDTLDRTSETRSNPHQPFQSESNKVAYIDPTQPTNRKARRAAAALERKNNAA